MHWEHFDKHERERRKQLVAEWKRRDEEKLDAGTSRQCVLHAAAPSSAQNNYWRYTKRIHAGMQARLRTSCFHLSLSHEETSLGAEGVQHTSAFISFLRQRAAAKRPGGGNAGRAWRQSGPAVPAEAKA